MNIEEAKIIIRSLKIYYEDEKGQRDLDKEKAEMILDKQDIQAIETLLTAYEKEKEKNKELYDKGYKDGLIKGLEPQILDNWNKENARIVNIKSQYVSKDKIKAKIEELKILLIETQKELGSASKEFMIYVYQKDILQSLLEEKE